MSENDNTLHLSEPLAQATGCKSLSKTSVLAAFGGHPQGERLERIQASPHFQKGRFVNPIKTPMASLEAGLLKDFVSDRSSRVPELDIPILHPTLDQLSGPSGEALDLTWLGHSSVLIQIDGRRVLTDPVFGPRASPLSWLGPKRFHAVPIEPEQLPPLDVIIVSHDHYDHLDFPTVSRMAGRDTQWVTSLGVGAHLEAWGIAPDKITELHWWEECEVNGLRIVATPARHFQGRGPTASKATFWSSFAVFGPRHSFWFSGDTGRWDEGFSEIGKRLGSVDLSLIEIGAWHPSWGSIHLGPENALRVHEQIGAKTMLPVHWGTFSLATHAWDQPICKLMELSQDRDISILSPMMGQRVHRESGIHEFWQRRYSMYQNR